jgi:hypothetical protein
MFAAGGFIGTWLAELSSPGAVQTILVIAMGLLIWLDRPISAKADDRKGSDER